MLFPHTLEKPRTRRWGRPEAAPALRVVSARFQALAVRRQLALDAAVIRQVELPLGSSSRFRTPPLPVTHARLATSLHTG